MLFNSYEFIFAFLPLTLLLFAVACRFGSGVAAMALLVAASLFFYAYWDVRFLTLLVGSVMLNFGAGRAMLGNKQTSGAFLIAGIIGNLAVLGLFKYYNFLVFSFLNPFGADVGFLDIALPLGISFFTFQQVAYLVDLHQRRVQDHTFLHYILFVTFFPQLIAGPIVHHGEMMPQFTERKAWQLNRNDLAVGLSFVIFGLFKKVIIADGLGSYVDPLFAAAADGEAFNAAEAWFAVLTFAFQIYFDFSAYSDIAIGLARMFGVDLPLNFHSPLRAPGIIELWRRWHMTMTRFFTDYLYHPLSIKWMRQEVMKGHGMARIFFKASALPMLITFTASGLWHGAGWTFIAFGVLNGIALVINHAWRRWAPMRCPTFLAWLSGFVFFIWSLSFFRADDMPAAMLLIEAMAGGGMSVDATRITTEMLGWLGVAALIVLAAPNTQEWMRDHAPGIDFRNLPMRVLPRWCAWQMTWPWGLIQAIMLSAALLGMLEPAAQFVYFQF